MNALIIYHDICMDGFGAAWSANYWLKKKEYDWIDMHPASYDDPIPLDKIDAETRVFILDFSYPLEAMETICNYADSVVLLDHHKTALENLGNFTAPNLYKHIDMNRSGAQMAWDYFSELCSPVPLMIRYIQDRDLWHFKLNFTKEIHAYLSAIPKTFRDWDIANELITHSAMKVVDSGILLLAQFNQQVESILATCKEEGEILGHKGLICNANGIFKDEVGNALANESGTFGATYFKQSNGAIKWSLRSIGDFDVAEIAKQFGGGGHKNAASFTLYPGPVNTDTRIKLWRIESDGN